MTKILLIILFTLPVITLAQSKKLWLEYGDRAFKVKDYATAIDYYNKTMDDSTIMNQQVLPYEVQMVNLQTKDFKEDTTKRNVPKNKKQINSKDYLNHQLAHCYRLNFEYDKAVNYFKKVTENGAYPEDNYYYGLALMHEKKYETAKFIFDLLFELEKNDSIKNIIRNCLSSCYFAQDALSNKKLITTKKLDSIVFNRGTSNFAPMYWNKTNRLIFTSARNGGVLIDPEKQDSKYLCDMYYTELKDTGWMKPVNFGRPVNTGVHDGSATISADDRMFFTRWSDANKDEAYIYMAKMRDGYFYEAYKLSETVNKQGYKAIQPYISKDGAKLFFSSNKPGGKGGFDLYMCNIDENGITSEAKNLGPAINSPKDELTPFFHDQSKTLFFSSNGHVGIGGLDIFKISLNVDDSVYAFPKNLGTPINSSKDDAYFILDENQINGYYASDREFCQTGNCYDIYEFKNEPITFDIHGVVLDDLTNDPIQDALITLRDVKNDDDIIYLHTNKNGEYNTPLKENIQYFIKAQKKGYQASAAAASTKGLTETTHLEQDFFLNIIPGTEVVIDGIEYDLNKATLRPKSMEVLDKIYDYLILNDNFGIEINAHTDTRATDSYNLKLSQARAQSCVDYLISKGIKKDRLVPTGFGETRPIISDAIISQLIPKSEEFEAAHQKNRRTAFRVMEEKDLNQSITPKKK